VTDGTDHDGWVPDHSGRGRPTLSAVARPFRQQVDEGILDRAAALFARYGFEQTSVQAVADAVGLSKAGLLHHFPSKDALHEAVMAQAESLGRRAVEHVRDLPLGPERDLRAVEVLVDIALAHPGLVAMMLAPAMDPGASAARDPRAEGTAGAALEAFGVDPATAGTERCVRVVGALAALAVLSLAAHQADQTTGWRRHIVATCLDALGSARTGVPLPDLDQVEA
jgi:AcrR family transcriptional regulator